MKKKRKILVWFMVLVMLSSVFSPMTAASQAKKKLKVKKITLNYSSYRLQKGKSLKLKVSFKPKKTTQKKITWTSSKKSVARVSKKGVVKALKAGKATITAKVKGTKKKAVCKIQVVDQGAADTTVNPLPVPTNDTTQKNQNQEITVNSIAISPSSMSICLGQTQQLQVNFEPAGVKDKRVKWESGDEKIATVSDNGLVTTNSVGKVTITATTVSGNKKASAEIEVKPVSVTGITIKTDKKEIKIGETAQLKAEIQPDNATNQKVTWSTSDEKIATVDEKGLVTAIAAGQVTITATSEDNKSKQDFVVIIVPEIDVTGVIVSPLECSIKPDEKVELTSTIVPDNATNKKISWSSSDSSVAVVSQAGVVTAVREGTVNITATTENGNKQAVCKVTVEYPVEKIELSDAELTLPAGETHELIPAIQPDNATNKKLTWESSDPAVASVDANGKITTIRDGLTDITATSQNGKSAVCKLKVETLPKKIILPEEKIINVDQEYTFTSVIIPENATNKNVIWESSDEQVVSVNAAGKIKGLKKGTAVITAKTEAGNLTAQCRVTVGAIETVTSFDKLQQLLKGEKEYDKIIVNSNENGTVEISDGNYKETILNVHAPNATVVNHGVFKKVEIEAISRDTWIEKATGNVLDVVAKESHVLISEGALSKIQIQGDAENVRIENNGTVSSLQINAAANISIAGENHTIIPVEAKSKNAVIDTAIPIELAAEEKVKLIIKPGAESQTTVSVSDADAMPEIEGIGVIQVTNKENNEISNVVAENNGAIKDDTGAEIKGIITGVVKDSEGKFVTGAAVYAIPYSSVIDQNDLEAAIRAAEEQNTCYMINTDDKGEYSLPLPYGNYALVVKTDGCNNYFQTLVVNQKKITNQTITMTPVTKEKGKLEGTLYDAQDASTVPAGIRLLLRTGSDNVSGDVISETLTDINGKYIFDNVEAGNYTIQVTDERDVQETYVRMSFNVIVLPGVTVKENMTITKNVKDQQVRFVLTWGKEAKDVPGDLDSHLVGPTSDKNFQFHTYYADKIYAEDGEMYADLDVDDVDYEGPETTTIYKAADGLYHFYIYNFTDQSDKDSTRLSTSQAMVKVFKGDQNIETYHVPNGVGTLWEVCTYDPAVNKLQPVNKLYFHPGDSENVGMEPLNIVKLKLKRSLDRYAGACFGEEVQVQIDEMLQGGKELLRTGTDINVIEEYIETMDSFFRKLLDSTSIYLSNDDENWVDDTIIRQGTDDDDSGYFKGDSVINIWGYHPSCIDSIQVRCQDDNATFEMTDSDKEGYQKLIIVKNSQTKCVEKYYVVYKEVVPELEPDNVTDADNEILDFYIKSDKEDEPYIYISGENEKLTDPHFEFSNKRIQGTYEASGEESEYAGKLTVQYKDHTKVYPVKYVQSFRTLLLEDIWGEDNLLMDLGSKWCEEDEQSYKVYTVSGWKDTLGNIECKFDVKVDQYTLVQENGKYWNYRIDVIYKGHLQRIYLDYQAGLKEERIIPASAECNGEQLSSIEMIKEGETAKIRLCGNLDDITDWESLTFLSRCHGLSYKIIEENGVTYLKINYQTNEIACYPIFYEKYISESIEGVTDGDNYIVDYDLNYSYDDDEERYEILYIYGENPQLGIPEIISSDRDITSSYEKVNDSDKGIGKLTLTYKTQKMVYWIRYKQQIRQIELQGIAADNSMFSEPEEEEQYDDEQDYKIWNVSGTKDMLDDSMDFNFNVQPESVEMRADPDGIFWNYVLTVQYKGSEQMLYVNYSQIQEEEILPTNGRISGNDLESIRLITEDGVKKVQVTGSGDEIADWDDVEFSNDNYDTLTYKVEAGGQTAYLVVMDGENELARYPVFYEKFEI